MGATRVDFIKYARTPHLFGSKGTDDDRHLGRRESEASIADPSLIVEEAKQSEYWQSQAKVPNQLAEGAEIWE